MQLQPITIGKHTLENNVVLAPLSGISDLPFRLICKKMGAGLVVSEMVACEALIRDNLTAQQKAEFHPEQGIVSVQIVGASPKNMAESAKMIQDSGADIIDINMGCPVKKVVNTYSGSALMKDEELVADILESVVNAVDIPVTLKFRTGWSEEIKNGENVAKIAEDKGIQALAVHGRTRAQMYTGSADWDFVGKIKAATKLPMLVNGDINSVQDAVTALEKSNCQGVMIGRACEGRPWFLGQVAHYLETGEILPDPTLKEQKDIVFEHYNLAVEHYGANKATKMMRKHLGWYTKGYKYGNEFRKDINKIENAEEVMDKVSDYYNALIKESESN
ncbi:MAG: putative tRNA-dihydrouridine synthase [Proteobacteria bacterium]|nr:MAG: putative tRNA-dihydrouridine synthase [Pseudomonadota bacterium]